MDKHPPDTLIGAPVTAAMLHQHADALEAHAAKLPDPEARAWRTDAAHVRDAALRLAAIQEGRMYR